MKRALACLLLLWFFYRIDPDSGLLIMDDGHATQEQCEAKATLYGYLVVPITTRPESRAITNADGTAGTKVIGYWRRTCAEGSVSRPTSTHLITITPR